VSEVPLYSRASRIKCFCAWLRTWTEGVNARLRAYDNFQEQIHAVKSSADDAPPRRPRKPTASTSEKQCHPRGIRGLARLADQVLLRVAPHLKKSKKMKGKGNIAARIDLKNLTGKCGPAPNLPTRNACVNLGGAGCVGACGWQWRRVLGGYRA
jgi:hypothetical protein